MLAFFMAAPRPYPPVIDGSAGQKDGAGSQTLSVCGRDFPTNIVVAARDSLGYAPYAAGPASDPPPG